jgi:hypothetical protein
MQFCFIAVDFILPENFIWDYIHILTDEKVSVFFPVYS